MFVDSVCTLAFLTSIKEIRHIHNLLFAFVNNYTYFAIYCDLTKHRAALSRRYRKSARIQCVVQHTDSYKLI